MATVSIGILGHQPITPSAEVMTLTDGSNAGHHFISIRLGEEASVIGPGLDREQIAYARALAAALTQAADEIERALAEQVEVAAP